MRFFTPIYYDEGECSPSSIVVSRLLRGLAFAWLVYGLVNGSIWYGTLDLLMTLAKLWAGIVGS